MGEPIVIENGVIIGKDEYLYLADGGHSVLQIVTGQKIVMPESFVNFSKNVEGRRAIAQKGSAKYLHVIFPDKQSVMQRQFPFDNPVCLGKVYQDRLADASVDILNLTDSLKSVGTPTFQRTDTHMNDLGVAFSAMQIAEEILGKTLDEDRNDVKKKVSIRRKIQGDLGKRFNPPRDSDELFINVDWKHYHLHNDIVGGNDGMVDIHFSPEARYNQRVLWFGDSFGRSCVRVLSYLFREIVFLRTRFFHEEIFFQYKPDVLITQNVERYMDYIEQDDMAPAFLMYPYLKQLSYAPSSSFAEAFSAMLSYPREPYWRWRGEIGCSGNGGSDILKLSKA